MRFVRRFIVFYLAFVFIPFLGWVRERPPQEPLLADTPQAVFEGEVVVGVEGLACPFCAFGLEKHLGRIEGVDKATVHLGDGKAVLVLKPGKQVSEDKIRRAVERAGFKASEIKAIQASEPRGQKVTVVGRVEKGTEGFFLILKEGTRFFLFDRLPQEAGEPLKQATAERLESLARTKTRVQIIGILHEHKGLPNGLFIETMEAQQ